MERKPDHYVTHAQAWGIFNARYLARSGTSSSEIALLVRDGQLRKIYGPWYYSNNADLRIVQALRARTRLGCLSALELYGVWVPKNPELHVCISTSEKKPTGSEFVTHRIKSRAGLPVSPPDEAIAEAVRAHDIETGLIVLESAVNNSLISYDMANWILDTRPRRDARTWSFFDPNSQSGSETRVRMFFQSNRISVRSQVLIEGVGYVDMLVGRSLIVECDSQAHHSSPEASYNDRQRDMKAKLLGFDVVRLSYRHIWTHWEQTQQLLLEIIRSRKHLRHPRPVRPTM